MNAQSHLASRTQTAASGYGTAISVAVVTVVTSTPVFLPGAANNLIRSDLGLHPSAIGLIFTFYWLGSVLGAYVSRRATGDSPVEKLISLSVFATALGLAAMAIYPQLGLWLGAAVGGFAYGFSQPYTNFLLMNRCASSIQGFAFGLKQAAVPAATLLCSLAVPLVAVPIGWRTLFALLAAFCLVFATVMWWLTRHSVTQRKAAAAGSLPLNPHLAALALAGAFGAAIGNTLGGFLITTLTEGGISLVTAGIIAAAASMTNIIVRLLAGIVTDRTDFPPNRLLLLMFGVGIVGTLLLTSSSHPAMIFGAVLAYGGGWGWAGLLHYVTSKAYPGHEGKATAISQMGVSAGAASGPLLFGVLFAGGGLFTAWAVMAVFGLLACLSVLLAHRFRPRQQ